jgi:hypothetical protein
MQLGNPPLLPVMKSRTAHIYAKLSKAFQFTWSGVASRCRSRPSPKHQRFKLRSGVLLALSPTLLRRSKIKRELLRTKSIRDYAHMFVSSDCCQIKWNGKSRCLFRCFRHCSATQIYALSLFTLIALCSSLMYMEERDTFVMPYILTKERCALLIRSKY